AEEFLLGEGVKPEQIDSGIQVMPQELLPPPTILKSASPYADNVVLLHLGYLNPTKNARSLISAMKAIDDPSLRLIIAGTGPDEAALRRMGEGDGRIIFHGWADDQQRANLMAWADLFVLPTLVDCWALVVNEALYYGTPVII